MEGGASMLYGLQADLLQPLLHGKSEKCIMLRGPQFAKQ
jgi:hypothetical protein